MKNTVPFLALALASLVTANHYDGDYLDFFVRRDDGEIRIKVRDEDIFRAIEMRDAAIDAHLDHLEAREDDEHLLRRELDASLEIRDYNHTPKLLRRATPFGKEDASMSRSSSDGTLVSMPGSQSSSRYSHILSTASSIGTGGFRSDAARSVASSETSEGQKVSRPATRESSLSKEFEVLDITPPATKPNSRSSSRAGSPERGGKSQQSPPESLAGPSPRSGRPDANNNDAPNRGRSETRKIPEMTSAIQGSIHDVANHVASPSKIEVSRKAGNHVIIPGKTESSRDVANHVTSPGKGESKAGTAANQVETPSKTDSKAGGVRAGGAPMPRRRKKKGGREVDLFKAGGRSTA